MSKLLIALYVIITSLALIVIKLSSKESSPISVINNKLHFNISLLAITGIMLYGISFMLYMYLISKFDLGYIIPLTAAFVYILIFTASYFIFKESFTIMKIIGIALIVLGLIFLNLKK